MNVEREDPDTGWLQVVLRVLRIAFLLVSVAAFVLFWLNVLNGDTHWAIAWLGIFITLRLDKIERNLRDE